MVLGIVIGVVVGANISLILYAMLAASKGKRVE